MSDLLSFLIYSPFPSYSGGRENWIFNLAPRLLARGLRVSVIAYRSDRPPFYPLANTGIELVSLPSVRASDRFFEILNRITLGLAAQTDIFAIYPIRAGRHLRRSDPGRLVCMNAIPEGLAAIVGRRKFVVSVRGDQPAELSARVPPLRRLYGWIERRVLARSELVLANGRDTQQRLHESGIESTIVPNGVDVARFAQKGSEDQITLRVERLARDRKLIVSVGTIRPIKGVDEAICSAEALKRQEPGFLLAIVGKGDPRRYQKLAATRGLEGWVDFPGETRNVPALLHRADVYLATSGGGGVGMAVLEAMAAGLPVVARDSPVYRQLIEDGRTGLLASGADAMAAACLRLFRDQELAAHLGREARLEARRYDWAQVAEALLVQLAS